MKKIFGIGNDVIVRVLLAVGAIALISYFLPKENKIDYNYALGRPWNYSLLTAPFDIPINLDSASAARQRDSINRTFVAIYKHDTSVDRKAILELQQALQGTSLSGQKRNHLIESVRRIYVDGIVDNATYDRIAAGALPEVRFVVNNVAEPTSTANMRSVRSAYAMLDSIFPDADTQTAIDRVRITRYLIPNVICDTAESKRMIDQLYQKALAPIGVMQKGERIIDRGDVVTPQTFELLKTYERLAEDRLVKREDFRYTIFGQIAIITLLIVAFYLFLRYFRWRIFNDNRKMLFLMSFLTLFTIASYGVIAALGSGLYVMPFAVVAVIFTTFFDSRTALFAHIIEVMLCSLVVPYPLEFIMLQFFAGVTAIITVQELSKRSQLVQCAIYIFLIYSLVYVALHVISDGDFSKVSRYVIGCFGINVVLFSFSYVLIFLIEKMFGFTSTVTLVELTDINNPILRELSEKCPGTFQHSMQVSSLAAEAAHAIGANSQLLRAGALYHDIGKIDNPAFFTENQRGENPHKALTPDLSARIVIEHVQNGLRRAVKEKLPQIIMDFITQHHGCGKAKYFFNQAQNASPDTPIDPEPYTYPGPNPNSKETSILMMADATEAASRSLTDHSDEAISTLVSRIIDSQIADGLFKDSPISFRDVEIIKRTFTERLRTIYHTRIAYPELKKKEE
ncbi:MAG: HDIG domain-containing protein [Muribaculaceae bacterium]|nr:HDIG domain-containing protein [Muribaculaceae bacterium]